MRSAGQCRKWMWVAIIALAPLGVASAQAPVTTGSLSCSRTEFEAVVDDAGALLRALTQKNSPSFQAKLRELKDKRGWTHVQFLAEGARFVRDDKISAFEDQSSNLLAKINGAGDGAANTKTPDCSRLAGLKADMATLVAIQSDKWTYMFGNIDAELAK